MNLIMLQFIAADVYGLYSYCFCDFGDEFMVQDANGEEPKQIFVADITKVTTNTVSSILNHSHYLNYKPENI